MSRNLYEWLKDYQALEKHIDYLEYQLDKEKSELSRWEGGNLSNLKLEAKSKAANLEAVIAELEADLQIQMIQKNKLLKLVYTFNGLDQEILRKKYIEGMTLEGISYELHYSFGYVRKKHTEIMKAIKLLDSWSK